MKCDAPLCPLDKGIEERVYLEGEPLCKMKPEDLAAIMGNGFENYYKKFIKICLRRGVRFIAWRKVKNKVRFYGLSSEAFLRQKSKTINCPKEENKCI